MMRFAERIIIIPYDYIILHLMTSFSQKHIRPDYGVLHPRLQWLCREILPIL